MWWYCNLYSFSLSTKVAGLVALRNAENSFYHAQHPALFPSVVAICWHRYRVNDAPHHDVFFCGDINNIELFSWNDLLLATILVN